MTLPKTYLAAVFESKDAPLTVKQVPLETPKHGEILIKVLACGVCYSDAEVQSGHLHNQYPIVPGHEAIGDIAAVPEDEDIWKVGDRVGAPWHGGHCGFCKQCRRGRFQLCDKRTVNGVYRNGGYAEYMILRREAVARVPKDVEPAKYAPFLCAGITTFNSIRNMDIPKGEIVAIQGLGGLGHLALQFANKLGFNVVALSSGPDKEKFARELGASHYVDGKKDDPVKKLQELGGAALIVATAPNPDAIAALMPGLQAGGKLLVLSPCGPLKVDTGSLVVQGLSVHGWPSGHALDSEEALQFAVVHDVNCLVETFPLKDAQKALEHMKKGKARFRAVITMV